MTYADSQTPETNSGKGLAQEEEAYLYAAQLAGYAALPMVLKAAIELGVLDLVVKTGPNKHLSTKEIATELSILNPDAPVVLDRLLRLLASYNILTATLEANEEDTSLTIRYGAAPVAKYFTRNSDCFSLANLLLFKHDKIIMGSWYHLKDTVLHGGIPFNRATGRMPFEFDGKDLNPHTYKLFNEAMSNQSTIIMNQILATYTGFDGLKSLVDVGGGIGSSLKLIISKYPTIKGINFDLPRVVASSSPFSGIEFVGGDMFESVPSGDAIFMKLILHDWSDELCEKLLQNCWKALPVNGKVIVAEEIAPEVPDSSNAAKTTYISDLMMLANTQGGKERTEGEFKLLAKKGGFSAFKVACCAFGVHIIELTK